MPSLLSNRKFFGWFIEGIAAFRIVEHFGEPGHNPIGNGSHIDFASEQFLHRSHRLTFARDDEIEKSQVSIHVQSEAMRRDPPRDVNSDRRDLAARRVHDAWLRSEREY